MEEEERGRKTKSERGAVCDVAQRNMAGYDVWRLKTTTTKKGQNSIKPYE